MTRVINSVAPHIINYIVTNQGTRTVLTRGGERAAQLVGCTLEAMRSETTCAAVRYPLDLVMWCVANSYPSYTGRLNHSSRKCSRNLQLGLSSTELTRRHATPGIGTSFLRSLLRLGNKSLNKQQSFKCALYLRQCEDL